MGQSLKYPDPYSNAATLCYGIICDHPFHNGNKRTALVALLVHLDKNKLTLTDVKEKDLYQLVLAIAKHEFVMASGKGKHRDSRPSTDAEVQAIARWIKERATPLTRGEKPLTYRELRRILVHFGFELGNPDGNFIGIYRIEEEISLFRGKREIRRHIGTISYRGENEILHISGVKLVRKLCKLRPEDGMSSDAFYGRGSILDTFVNQYRRILVKLAHK